MLSISERATKERDSVRYSVPWLLTKHPLSTAKDDISSWTISAITRQAIK